MREPRREPLASPSRERNGRRVLYPPRRPSLSKLGKKKKKTFEIIRREKNERITTRTSLSSDWKNLSLFCFLSHLSPTPNIPVSRKQSSLPNPTRKKKRIAADPPIIAYPRLHLSHVFTCKNVYRACEGAVGGEEIPVQVGTTAPGECSRGGAGGAALLPSRSSKYRGRRGEEKRKR